MIETTHRFKHCVAMTTEHICIEAVNLFQISCFVRALDSSARSYSLKIRHDHIFETSRFVSTGLECLQICIKLISCVESCRRRLTHWVGVMLASICSNNRFANNFGLADMSLINNSFTCEHYWWSPTISFPTFESKPLSVYVNGWNFALVQLCRQMLARLGKVHASLSISILLLR